MWCEIVELCMVESWWWNGMRLVLGYHDLEIENSDTV
jgi:hypothetical protein